jgi:hypothetical protein
MQKTISESYILGIKEGRQFLNANPNLTIDEIKNEIAANKKLARQFSGDMKESFKGTRDFWLNQLKKRKALT